MKKLLYVACAVGLMTVAMSATSFAAGIDSGTWLLNLTVPGTGLVNTITDTTSGITVGTDPASLDGLDGNYDTEDSEQYTDQGVGAHIIGFNSSFPTNGKFLVDVRAPLNPGEVKTYGPIVVWANTGYSASNIYLVAGGSDGGNYAPLPDLASNGITPIAYKLVLTNAPIGSNYATGTTWLIPTDGSQLIIPLLAAPGKVASANQIPTLNGGGAGTYGYTFNLVVPEPSSMIAMAAGLVGFAGLLRKRS